jgi:hypothetical protein
MAIARAAPGKCETPCATQRKGNSHETHYQYHMFWGEQGGNLFYIFFSYREQYYYENCNN